MQLGCEVSQKFWECLELEFLSQAYLQALLFII